MNEFGPRTRCIRGVSSYIFLPHLVFHRLNCVQNKLNSTIGRPRGPHSTLHMIAIPRPTLLSNCSKSVHIQHLILKFTNPSIVLKQRKVYSTCFMFVSPNNFQFKQLRSSCRIQPQLIRVLLTYEWLIYFGTLTSPQYKLYIQVFGRF